MIERCPKAKYHKFFMGVCENCGLSKLAYNRELKESRLVDLRASRARRKATKTT